MYNRVKIVRQSVTFLVSFKRIQKYFEQGSGIHGYLHICSESIIVQYKSDSVYKLVLWRLELRFKAHIFFSINAYF